MITELSAPAEALIEEARQHRRRRWLRASALIVAAVLALTATAIAIRLAASGRGPHAGRPPGRISAAAASAPPEIVVVTGLAQIAVVSSRTLRVIRILATNAAMFQGPETLSASPAGLLFFDSARHYSERVLSVPLAGGHVRMVAFGRTPAVSPNGQLLAYVAETKGSAMRGPRPTGIVVRDLATGAQRSWSIPVADAYIPEMTWSPDGRHLAVTTGAGNQGPSTLVLDTRAPGRTLGAARRMSLPAGVSWAEYLTARTGVGVAVAGAYPALRESLVEIDVRTGKAIRALTSLRQVLLTGNSSDGPEGTIQPDPTGHYFLITGTGPVVKIPAALGSQGAFGEIFLWTPGMRRPVPILHRFIQAIWAGVGHG